MWKLRAAPVLGALFVLVHSPGTALAVLLQSGDIVVASQLGGTATGFCFGAVVKVNPQSAAQEIIANNDGNLCRPSGVAIDSDGTIYVSGSDPNLPGSKITRIDGETGARSTLTQLGNLNAPNRLALDGQGNLLAANINNGLLVRVDLGTGQQTVLASGAPMTAPNGVDVAANGAIFVADFNPGPGGLVGDLIQVDALTGDQTLLLSTGALPTPVDLQVGPDGMIYVVTSFGAGLEKVYRYDPADAEGSETEVYSAPFPLQNIESIAFEADGKMLVTIGGQIRRVDLVSGSDVIVAQGGDLAALSQVAVFAGVPEPAVSGLLGLGLALVAARRRGAARNTATP